MGSSDIWERLGIELLLFNSQKSTGRALVDTTSWKKTLRKTQVLLEGLYCNWAFPEEADGSGWGQVFLWLLVYLRSALPLSFGSCPTPTHLIQLNSYILGNAGET